ncbi:MAG: AmmeMemoRadiSam system protein A [Bacilli bacterium]|jgi:AmmeMemoRadiSam system protein A/AmmeMemoRadiSam system protein B|nr:AmmeMemoRadiSam system protein A [Bacilli bacterium]
MAILGAFIVPHPPIILPEIGRGEEKKISQTTEAYEKVMEEISNLHPETVIITSPHSVCYFDYFHISPGKEAEGDFGRFGAPEVALKTTYDQEFAAVLSENCLKDNLSAGEEGEKDKHLDHGTMIPLYFLNKHYFGFKTVRIGLSGLPALDFYKLGQEIQKTADLLNRNIVLIASGDLSHCLKEDGPYGFKKEGPEFDQAIVEMMKKGDFRSFFSFEPAFLEKAEECGLGSFQILAGTLDKKAVKSEFLSYQGPFGVGYAVSGYTVIGVDEKNDIYQQILNEKQKKIEERKAKEDPLVKLARLSVESFVLTGKTISVPSNLPEEIMKKKAGVFVSLHKDGQLRGCIGTFSPCYQNIATEVINNGVEACSQDPRFNPVEAYELPDLEYSVDVLSPFEKISSVDQLDAKRYGVIVQNGSRRGLLLPNLDGVDTPDEQIEIAKKKAGIRQNENVILYRFEAVRHL